jgi:IS1 family transposase/transposase-like protein
LQKKHENYHITVCPFCNNEDLVKNGHSETGTQRWCCNKCKKSFRLKYKYNTWKAGTEEAIIQQTLNSSGVRDISRNLRINKNTVVSVFKKTLKTNSYFLTGTEDNPEVDIKFNGEMDEFWSFVQNKSNQRRTWYAIERQSGCILAWHNGKRQDKDFLELWNLLKIFNIDKYYTDDWGAYSKYIPPDRHKVGKDNTWKIERKNLNFRTHLKRLNRKTICFSKNETVHDNVIGMYMEAFYYKTGTYGNNFIN